MTVTVESFRVDLPEFADIAKFPDAAVAFWLKWALLMVNEDRWGDVFDLGVEMFVAHNLALERRAQVAAAKGGIPGMQPGVLTGSSVDKVSVGYDASAGINLGAGHWNLTIYGTRFYQMAQQFGAGPITIEGGSANGVGGAWQGPWQSTFPNPS